MQRKESQAERQRKEAVALVTHYREIGPAAIQAALACAHKASKAQKQAAKRY